MDFINARGLVVTNRATGGVFCAADVVVTRGGELERAAELEII
jgi:hypothetical protein